jgi:hypothetical protein
LLKLIKRWPPANLDIQKSAASIERILDTYSREFIGHKLPAPERKELAFWFTLYQFEEVIGVAIELKENPFQSKIILPYQALTEKNLANSSGSKAASTLNRIGTDLHDCGFSRY